VSRKFGPNSAIAYAVVQSRIHIQASWVVELTFALRHQAAYPARLSARSQLGFNSDAVRERSCNTVATSVRQNYSPGWRF
jgi:hypothetical protein